MSSMWRTMLSCGEVESDESSTETSASPSRSHSRSHSKKKRKVSNRSSNSSIKPSLPVKRPSASSEEPDPKRKKNAVTIEDLLKIAGVTEEDMEKVCSQDDLLALSKFCDPWELIGQHLKLTSSQISAIDNDNKTMDQKHVGVLQKWKETSAHKATYRVLVNVLLACDKAQHALEVCGMLAGSNSPEDTQDGSQQNQIRGSGGIQTRQRSAKSQPPRATSNQTSDKNQKQNGKIPAPSSLKGMSQPACSSTPKVVRGVNKQCRSLPSASLKNKDPEACHLLKYNQQWYQFITSPPKDLLCQKCHQLAYEPHQLKRCNKLHCKSCLPSSQCYLYRGVNVESFTDGLSNDRIQDLMIKCPNSSADCSWEGRLGSVMEHRSKCEK